MVRRRSCLVTFTHDVSSLVFFKNYQRKKLFRKSVKFKKFHFKGTYFKRRQIRKIKHKSYWALQYNLLKYWTNDVRISRQYARFQYHYRFFVNNSLTTYHVTWTARRNRFFVSRENWVSSSLTRWLFTLTGRGNNDDILFFQQSNHHAVSFYLPNQIIGDRATTFFVSSFDKQFFTSNVETTIDELDVFIENHYLNNLILAQIVEFYKILSFLWSLHTLKLKFYVY